MGKHLKQTFPFPPDFLTGQVAIEKVVISELLAIALAKIQSSIADQIGGIQQFLMV
jgi:hypothetical protein